VQNYVLKQPENRIYLGRQYRVLKALPVLFPIVGTLKIYISRIKPIIYHTTWFRDIIFELIDKRE
jgi:hypothetical protein